MFNNVHILYYERERERGGGDVHKMLTFICIIHAVNFDLMCIQFVIMYVFS